MIIFNLDDSHVIPGLLHKMVLASKEYTTSVTIRGSGKAMRQFVYVDDFAKAIIKILFDERIKDGVINICDSKEYSIKEIVDKLVEYTHISPDLIKYDTNHSDGILKKTVSNRKLLAYYPDFKFTSIDQGLLKTVSWFRKQL